MELTERRKAWRDVEELIGRINRKLRGWSNYFRIGTVSKAYRNIDSHVRYRVRQWLCTISRAGARESSDSLTSTCTRSWDCTSFNETTRQRFVGERV